MKDKVKVIFKNLHDFSEIEASNLRIEYAGQSIEFRGGRIEIEPIEPARRENMPKIEGKNHYEEHAVRKMNLPPVMHW